MGHALIDTTIESYFNTNFSLVKDVAWPNTKFTPGKEYVRPTVMHGKPVRLDMGQSTAIYRYNGIFIVQIFTAPNIGKGRALTIADNISDTFRSQLINGVQFFEPYITVIGNTDAYYQVNVSCPYYMDQIQ